MRVGVIQSSYVPWRGYFDFIRSVDVFVIYDDVQYSSGSWRNRNQLKTADGPKWLTVPIRKRFGQAIDEVEIDSRQPWLEQNRGLIRASLSKAPFFSDAADLWEDAITAERDKLGSLNLYLITKICAYLGIQTQIEHSRAFELEGSKTDRLISLLGKLGAKTYLSGPSARDYLEPHKFHEHGIALEYKSYDYAPYPQLWGDFLPTVSVLDLIANTGPAASVHLSSGKANLVVIP